MGASISAVAVGDRNAPGVGYCLLRRCCSSPLQMWLGLSSHEVLPEVRSLRQGRRSAPVSARIVRQLLAEGIFLGTLGGVVAHLAGRVLASYITLPWMPVALDVSLDGRFFLGAFGGADISVLLASLVPALRLSHVALHQKSGEREMGMTGKLQLN